MCAQLLGACALPPELPDPSDPAVRAEEQRIAGVLAADPVVITPPGRCSVRLLRQEEGTSYTYALCTNGTTSVAMPVRVDGEEVTTPEDGSGHTRSIEAMFPGDLAAAVLERPQDYRPGAPPGRPG
ncbi:hypothetical protein NUM3379_31500 [Kineococcus sp. NUM-3379]